MVQELSFNKKMGIAKLILSSLFARKQDYLVVNAKMRNRLLFTNLSAERAAFYKPDIDDTLMSVTMTDKSADIVYELFPILKEVIAVIHLPTFLSTVNKKIASEKNVSPKVLIDAASNNLYIQMNVADNGDPFGVQSDASGKVVVGSLITEDIFMKYVAIMEHFLNFVKEPLEREISIPQAFENDRVIKAKVEIPNGSCNCMVGLNLPIQDGTTLPSFKEYLTKKKLPWKYRAVIQYNEKQSVAKVSYMFRDDYVDVVSIAPGTLWFPYRMK